MSLNFENASILSLAKQTNYFESEYAFSCEKNISVQGFFFAGSSVGGVKEIQQDLDDFVSSTDGKLHDVIINGHNFGKGKVNSFSSGTDNSVRLKEYNVDLTIFENGDLSNLTGETYMEAFQGIISDPNRKFIRDFSEEFSFSKSDGAYDYSHELSIQFLDHGDSTIDDPIDLGKSLAKTILETDVDFGFIDSEVGGFYNLAHKKYHSETYDKVNKVCSFSQSYSQISATDQLYSTLRSHSLGIDENGGMSISETGEIQALTDVSAPILRGYVSAETAGAFARCQSVEASFNDGKFLNSTLDTNSKTDHALVDQHIGLTKSFDHFSGSAKYSIDYNNSLDTNVGFIAERNISIDLQDEIAMLKESGTITGLGGMEFDEEVIYFADDNDYVDVGTKANSLFDSDFSIFAKIKIDQSMGSASRNFEIISNEDSQVNGFRFWISDDNGSDWGEVYFRSNQAAADQVVKTDAQAFPNDQDWHHVGVVKSGGTVEIYIDGILSKTGAASDVSSASSSLILGGPATESGSAFRGYMSSIRVYDTPLISTEVSKLYNNLYSEKKNNLKIHYSFNLEDEMQSGSGDSLVSDLSGSYNSATMSGAYIVDANEAGSTEQSQYEKAINGFKSVVEGGISGRLNAYYSDVFPLLGGSVKEESSSFSSNVGEGSISYEKTFSNNPSRADSSFKQVTTDEQLEMAVTYKNDFKILASGQAKEQYKGLTPTTKSVKVKVLGKRETSESACKEKAVSVANSYSPTSMLDAHINSLSYDFSDKEKTYSLDLSWSYYEDPSSLCGSTVSISPPKGKVERVGGLVSMWRMDESSSGVVSDSYGSNHGFRSFSTSELGEHRGAFSFNSGDTVDFGRGEGCPVSGDCIQPLPVYAACATPTVTSTASPSVTATRSFNCVTLTKTIEHDSRVLCTAPTPTLDSFYYGPFVTPSFTSPRATPSFSQCVRLVDCPACGWDEIFSSKIFSISMWYKPNSAGKVLIKKYDSTSPPAGTSRDNSFILTDGAYTQADGSITTFAQGTLGAWNHLVLTCSDGRGGAQNGIYVYLNNSKIKEITSPLFDISNETSLIAGGNFEGGMDDLRIYNRALRPFEISMINSGKDILPSGLSPYIPSTPSSTPA